MSVAIVPGNTMVTRTLVLSSSLRKPSVKSLTAAFDAPYIVCPGTGTSAPMLEIL